MTADEKEAFLVEIFENIHALKQQSRELNQSLDERKEEYYDKYEEVQEKKETYNKNLKVICGIDRRSKRYRIMMKPLEIKTMMEDRKAKANETKVSRNEEDVRLYLNTSRTLEEDLEIAIAEAEELEVIIDAENRDYQESLEALKEIKNDIAYLRSEIRSREKMVAILERRRKKIDSTKVTNEAPQIKGVKGFRLIK